MNEQDTIVVTESLHEVGLALLAEHGEVVRLTPAMGEGERRAALGSASAIITQVHPIDRELIAAAGRLRVIGKHGVGVDNIDIAAATEHGVSVVNTPGANARSVAEHTLAMLLSLARRLPVLDQAVREGDFGIRRDLRLADLHGRTIGVLGAGHTGRMVLELCCGALGMRGIAYDVTPPDPSRLPAGCEVARTLDETLSRSDAISINLPLTPSTRGMIGERELSLLRPGAFVINVGRGGVVDEAALAAAVRSGVIAGAAVDVFAAEPPDVANPLLNTPGIILSPHAAGLGTGAGEEIARRLAGDVLRVLRGERPEHAVNAEV
ncbi:hydroxyacid dehydrogenase [Nonomuraea sp. NPDC046802]|uniref:hydroxyacid dehydrogenase n=1 Tax=Nonomuraea sp. NPDC046802 TaxID=3154919 RepID=UPI0033E7006B